MSLLLLAFFIFSAEKCGTSEGQIVLEQKEITSKRFDSIEKVLATDHLNKEARLAFEEKAKIKLKDLGDYFSIYANSELDSSFRNITRNLIEKLFLDTKRFWNIKLDYIEMARDLQLYECLENVNELPFTSIDLRIDSIRTVQALNRSGEEKYQGVLAFTQSINAYLENDTVLIEAGPKLVDFFVIRIKMELGDESLQVWKVFLGDIKNVDAQMLIK